MKRTVQTICTQISFPKPVADYLIERFPEHVSHLVVNSNLDPASFTSVSAAKASANFAEALVSLNNPDIISDWCKSRDKRQGVSDIVLRYWHLPKEEQLAYASKPLSEDSAREVLRSNWFADDVKLIAAQRASGLEIWSWLDSEPASLSDEDWIKAVSLASGKYVNEVLHQAYSTFMQRPHLAQRLLESDAPGLSMLAASMVSYIDPSVALDRIANVPPEWRKLGLIPFLDHPSLPRDIRVRGLSLADSCGLSEFVHRIGVPSPDSPMTLGVPLYELKDKTLVEMVAMRSLSTSTRIAQFVQLSQAPGAPGSILYRTMDIPRSMLHSSPSYLRPLKDLAKKTNTFEALTRGFGNVLEAFKQIEERNTSQALVSKLSKPMQHTPARRNYLYHYGDSNAKPPAPEDLLNSSFEDLPQLISGYRVSPESAKVCSTVMVERLGDGTTPDSLRRWENFFQLAPKMTSNMKFSAVLSMAVRLK